MKRRTLLGASMAACTVAGSGLAGPAAAQAMAQNARLIIGFAAGGTGDFVARVLAEQLRARQFAGSVIVENRPGAGGVLAVQTLKAALPDGLSLLNTPASVLTILPHTHKKQPFDPLNDVLPVATVSDIDFAVVAHASVPAQTLPELMALARREPRHALYGTAGVGTMSHVLGALLARRAGVTLVHAPYRGGGPVLQDVTGGQIPFAILALSETLLRSRQEGRLQLLATSGARRSRFLPDVPTIEQAGYPGVVASDWNTLVAPVGTPQPVLERISRLVLAVTEDPQFGGLLSRMCIQPLGLARADMAERLRAEHQAMGKLVRDERISVDS